jgi:hypothetical protein
MSDREYIVDKIQTKLYPKTFKALLGRGDSGHTVAVAGKASYVYIRLKSGSELGAPVEALNRQVPPIHGRMVRVKEIDRAGIKGFEVIGFDDRGTPYYHDDTGHTVLPAHGHTHECNQADFGTDPVNLYTRGWAELRVEPTDPCSMYCYVTRGWYLFDVPAWFTGGNTPLFTAPTLSRYDLVYIDSSGTINIEQGTEGAPGTLTFPEPPDYTIPLALVNMTGSTGCISEDMILDCRVMPNVKYPPGGTIFDDSITPAVVQSGIPPWSGDDDYASRADHRHSLAEPLRLLDADAGAPAYSFASDTTKGMFNLGDGGLGFATDGTLRMEIDPTGSVFVGDCEVNFTRFMPDGEMLRDGTARTQNAVWVGAQGLRAPPDTKPATFVEVGISGAWEFSDATDDTVVANIRVPYRMDRRVAPDIGFGWSSPTADPGDDSKQATWQVEYLWTSLDESTAAAAEGTLSTTVSASTVANGFVFSSITLTAPSSTDQCLHMRLRRRGDTDSLGDVAHLHGMCMIFTSYRLGEGL